MKPVQIFDGVNKSPEQIQEELILACEELKNLLLKKNQEYKGSSFKTGLNGNFARLHDKMDRYEVMIRKIVSGEKVHFESLRDTLQDIAGYAIIGLVIYDNVEKHNDTK